MENNLKASNDICEEDGIISLRKLSEDLTVDEVTRIAFMLGLKFEQIYQSSSIPHIMKLFKIWKYNQPNDADLCKVLIMNLESCGLLQKFQKFNWNNFHATDSDMADIYGVLSIKECFELCENLGVSDSDIQNAKDFIGEQSNNPLRSTFEIFNKWWETDTFFEDRRNRLERLENVINKVKKCPGGRQMNMQGSKINQVSSKNGIIERHEWKAIAPMFETPLKKPVKTVIIAHTTGFSGFNERTGKYHSKSCVQYIQNSAINDLEWDDLPYNFLIGLDGNIYVGRGWSNVGAHTIGYNRRSISIAVIGDFMKEDAPIWLEEVVMKLVNIGVENGTLIKDFEIIAHRDASNTKSPGDKIYKQMQNWKFYGKKYKNENIKEKKSSFFKVIGKGLIGSIIFSILVKFMYDKL